MANMQQPAMKTRVAIIGYGMLGQYLVNAIQNDKSVSQHFDIALVWNRSVERLASVQPESVRYDGPLDKLFDNDSFGRIDLVVEVCHPSITQQYGAYFLQHADLFVGSPTAFADTRTESTLREIANNGQHGIYVPSGALWGADDIAKMGSLGTLRGLTVTMKKHPQSLKLEEPLKAINDAYIADQERTDECVLFDGSVGELCPLSPNNVNTMACAALASGPNVGFSKTRGRLVADKRLDAHIVEIEVDGPDGFSVKTVRHNPAKVGAVTGNATYGSFLSSLLRSRGRGNGLFFV